jgi:steroid delta-isomerase-like uncharacterized protein
MNHSSALMRLVGALALLIGTSGCAIGDTHKQDVLMWYEAFDKNEPALIDKVLSKDWTDVPSPPGQPAGPEGAKRVLAMLTSTFPDLKVTTKDVIEQGNKVVVRSEITGTQRSGFLGFPTKNEKLQIMAIDIHEFKDGKIVRTWHTEDWMTGLRQLGVLER